GEATEENSVVSIWTSNTCSGTALSTGTVTGGAFAIDAFDLGAIEGVQDFYFKITDGGGAASTCTSTGLSYTLDSRAPQSPLVQIESNAASTAFKTVSLTLSATETFSTPVEMCVTEAETCGSCSSWEPYATSKDLALSEGFGTKTIAAKFRDSM